jgi:hypothetical protein
MTSKNTFSLKIDRDKLFDFLANADSSDEAMSTLGHSIVGALLANGEDWKDHVFFDLVGLDLKKQEGTVVTDEFLNAAKEVAGSLNRFVDLEDEDDIIFKINDAEHDLKVFNEQAEKEGLLKNGEPDPKVNPEPGL